MTKVCLLWQNFCCDRNICCDKSFVVTSTFLSWRKMCFVATNRKEVFCHDKHKRCVLSWRTCVCHDKTVVMTKIILQAAPANDSFKKKKKYIIFIYIILEWLCLYSLSMSVCPYVWTFSRRCLLSCLTFLYLNIVGWCIAVIPRKSGLLFLSSWSQWGIM